MYLEQLWTAPELLRDPTAFKSGTQKGDVYSFALVLHEMLFRKGAFYRGEEEFPEPQRKFVKNIFKFILTDFCFYVFYFYLYFIIHISVLFFYTYFIYCLEILERVKERPINEDDSYRPVITEEMMEEEGSHEEDQRKLVDLMDRCWRENPHDRFEFRTIRTIVHTLNK